MPVNSSRLPGLHRLTLEERAARVADLTGLDEAERARLAASAAGFEAMLDAMVENAIAAMPLPLGVATNLIVDGREILVPMATEESSVIAAVCHAAKLARAGGGVETSLDPPHMIAQIQVLDLADPHGARLAVLARAEEAAAICAEADPVLHRLGGGFRGLEARVVPTGAGVMLIVHLIVDARDAMGANAVNTMAERLAPEIARWSGGRTLLRILSNLADRRLARARARWPADAIGGARVVDDMVAASAFASADPYRAATHNKGIMNGVAALAIACGQDTRALEAGAHAFAARGGRYAALSRFERTAEGDLSGVLELPLAVGVVGGAVKAHPMAAIALKILGARDAAELARAMVAVGLAQNFAALLALATTGIQRGHMALHAKNLALTAGAIGDEIDAVASAIAEAGAVTAEAAEAALARLREGKSR